MKKSAIYLLLTTFVLSSLIACDRSEQATATSETAETEAVSDSEPSSPAAEEGAVAVQQKAPKVDTLRTVNEIRTNDMAMNITMQGESPPPQQVHTVETVTRTEKILEVSDAGVVTAMEVTFEKFHQKKTENGMEEEMSAPMEGKTYRVAYEDGAVQITENDAPVDEMEKMALLSTFPGFGHADPLVSFFAETTFEKGKTIELSKEQVSSLVGQQAEQADALQIEKAEITLASVSDNVGTFETVLDMTMSSSEMMPMKVQMPLNGTIQVSLEDGQIISMNLKGDVEMEGGQQPDFHLTGKGTMQVEQTVTLTN